MGQRLRQIRDMEPEELQKLKTSVIQSVKNSGAQTLANYIQTIYYNIYQKQPPKKPPLFHLPSSLHRTCPSQVSFLYQANKKALPILVGASFLLSSSFSVILLKKPSFLSPVFTITT